jgi:hypothetical protein
MLQMIFDATILNWIQFVPKLRSSSESEFENIENFRIFGVSIDLTEGLWMYDKV